MTSNCSNGHAQTWKCHETQPLTCRLCERDAKRAAEKLQKDFELQKKRDAEQQEHDEKMAKIQERRDAQIQAQKDLQLAKDREAALKQQEQDVKDAEERLQQKVEAEKRRKEEEKKREAEEKRKAVEQAAASSSSIASVVIDTVKSAVNTLTGTSSTSPTSSTPSTSANQPPSGKTPTKDGNGKKKTSEAQSDWQRRKDVDGAANPHIDAIMEMIGLEPVKQQVLKIMDKVDVTVRQGTSLAKERFNVVLLGNPGTGIIRWTIQSAIRADNIPQGRLQWQDTTPNS